MDIRTLPLVPELRLYEAAHISRERGRRRCAELEEQLLIKPVRTPTGRVILTFEDAERLAAAL